MERKRKEMEKKRVGLMERAQEIYSQNPKPLTN